jgi:hypothetical protein
LRAAASAAEPLGGVFAVGLHEDDIGVGFDDTSKRFIGRWQHCPRLRVARRKFEE